MPKKPFDQLANRQKKKIMRVCTELLAGNGYNNTSVKMITRRLRVADGYLHYYFEGKEDLIKWTIETGLDKWIEHFKKHVENKKPQDVFELLRMTVFQMIRFTKDHRDLLAAYMTLVNEPNLPLADYLAEKISWIDRLFIEKIAEEADQGNLRNDLPPVLVAMVMDTISTRIQEFVWNPSLDPIGISKMTEKEVAQLLDQLLSMLREGMMRK